MTCNQTRPLLSSYLDGAISGGRMLAVRRHLDECGGCGSEFAALRQTQALVSGLGRRTAPPDLALRLRVAISREAAQAQRGRWEPFLMRLQEGATAFLMPATAGAVAAVLFFALMIGMFAVPARVEASDDVPTVLYTPPQLVTSPAQIGLTALNADSLLVETFVDSSGRVQDYRIISAPVDAEHLLPELKHTLIFTVFRPATAFGRPTAGRVVLSFSRMEVTG
jgi:hypothetical protein